MCTAINMRRGSCWCGQLLVRNTLWLCISGIGACGRCVGVGFVLGLCPWGWRGGRVVGHEWHSQWHDSTTIEAVILTREQTMPGCVSDGEPCGMMMHTVRLYDDDGGNVR